MSTLQHTPQRRAKPRSRSRVGGIAVTALIAIGLGVLIVATTSGHGTVHHRPNTAPTTHTHPIPATVSTRPTAGCLRDPQTHALFCTDSALAPYGIPTPPGYVRDSGTPELMRVANQPDPAGQLPAEHSHGRIIP
jgi:hypothetical protein